MTAAQSENRVGSPYSPEHTRSFEAGADYSLAARFDHTRANKQMLAPKLGISHALRIPRKVVRFRAYLLGIVGIVSIHGTKREHQLFDFSLLPPLLVACDPLLPDHFV